MPTPPVTVSAPVEDEVDTVELDTESAELNVLAPEKVCVLVETTPLALEPASGRLNVCVEVAEDIAKSFPDVPVAKDCEAAVKVFSVVIPPAGAPVWSSSQDNVTLSPEIAEAAKTCPAVGVSIGSI